MPSDKCPDCSARLGGDKCRQCGWQHEAVTGRARCAGCTEDASHLQTFPDDGHPEDRGRRLCAACWVRALKRRAERDPISKDEFEVLRRMRARYLGDRGAPIDLPARERSGSRELEVLCLG